MSKRKVKRSAIFIIGIISFFIIYFISFKAFSGLGHKEGSKPVSTEEKVDSRSLLSQFKSKNKIYISDGNVSNVRMEDEKVEEFRYSFNEFSKIRTPDSYKPVYEGYTDDDIRFSTDLNLFRIYTVNEEVYYKIPVSEKTRFEKVLSGSIYTSFDFVKKYKTWKNVSVSYNDQKKTIHKWKYDDLAYKMSSKRIVGKIQPEKNKERSKYNFTIDIHGDNYTLKIETMGKDYVKISSDKGEAYYEVSIALYEYLREEIFKLPVDSDDSE